MGPWGGNGTSLTGTSGVGVDYHMIASFFDHRAAAGERITKVVQYDTAGLVVSFSDGTSISVGKVKDADSIVEFPLSDASQMIHGAYGAWDSRFKCLRFRTNVLQGGYYDNGNHLGGDDGEGQYFFARNGPDGTDSVLTGVFGYTTSKYGLTALGFYWKFTRAEPRSGWTY